MGTATVSETINPAKRQKILIVDNEQDITSLFRKALMREGFSVDIYNDPADSLRNFKPHFYDLIILDIIMPDMDGFQLYNQLRKVDPDIKVMFLTASQKHLDTLNKERYHKGQFLIKPITIRDLVKEVNQRLSTT